MTEEEIQEENNDQLDELFAAIAKPVPHGGVGDLADEIDWVAPAWWYLACCFVTTPSSKSA